MKDLISLILLLLAFCVSAKRYAPLSSRDIEDILKDLNDDADTNNADSDTINAAMKKSSQSKDPIQRPNPIPYYPYPGLYPEKDELRSPRKKAESRRDYPYPSFPYPPYPGFRVLPPFGNKKDEKMPAKKHAESSDYFLNSFAPPYQHHHHHPGFTGPLPPSFLKKKDEKIPANKDAFGSRKDQMANEA